MSFVTVEDINRLFRPLTESEAAKAEALIPMVEARLKQEALLRNKNLDDMIVGGELIEEVLQSVIIDIVGRTLLTSTTTEPMTQYSEAALGYSVSGSFLNPGGGIFIKNSELKILGLKKQRMGVIDLCPCLKE